VNLEDLRFPIGPFLKPGSVSAAQLDAWIGEIARLPADLRAVVEPLDDMRLDTPYRPGGWTVRQVVHHLADSHVNSYIRFKWALTEDCPTIKTYFEERWAELPDSSAVPIAVSLALLDALHERWTGLLRALAPDDLHREFLHPDSGPVRLDVNVGIYAWHGRHHLAHITRLAEREGWSVPAR
jgi:DinB superfamily